MNKVMKVYEAHSNSTKSIKFGANEWIKASEPVLEILGKGMIKKGEQVEITLGDNNEVIFIKGMNTGTFKKNYESSQASHSDNTDERIMRQTAMKCVIPLITEKIIPMDAKVMEDFMNGFVEYYKTGVLKAPESEK